MLKVHQPEFRIGEFAITEFIQKYIQFVVMSQEGPEGHSCHTPCGITRTGPFFHPTCWGLVFNHVSHRPVRHCGNPSSHRHSESSGRLVPCKMKTINTSCISTPKSRITIPKYSTLIFFEWKMHYCCVPYYLRHPTSIMFPS